MRSIILIITCVLLITPLQAAEQQTNQSGQIQQRLENQEQRLANINEQVSLKQKRIEEWYNSSLAGLHQLAQRKARFIKLDYRALWAEFFKMKNPVPQFDTYYIRSTTIFTRQAEASLQHAAMLDSYFMTNLADLFLDPDFRDMLSVLASGSSYNPEDFLIRKNARILLYYANEFQSKLQYIEKRKAVKLAALAQWEKDVRADVSRVKSEIKAETEKSSFGVVSAIGYNQNNPICMIDGSDTILREGDAVGDIRITKISQEQVSFAKNAQEWTQEVGKPANAAWQ